MEKKDLNLRLKNDDYRVCLVNADTILKQYKHESYVDDETFMSLAENEGTVYSLKGFQNAWNEDFISYPDCAYIRIIRVR